MAVRTSNTNPGDLQPVVAPTYYQRLADVEAQMTGAKDSTVIDGINTQLADIVTLNVKKFGAKGDGVTDDTVAIQNAFNSLAQGQVLLIPAGNYVITGNLTFTISNATVQQYGAFIGGGTITISGFMIKWYGLNISRTAIWNDGVVGVTLDTLNNSEIHVEQSFGFGVGVKCVGTNAGFAYNKIFLNYIMNNKIGVLQTSVGTGWCNENTFYGGRIAVTTNYKTQNNGDPGWGWKFDKGTSSTTFNDTRLMGVTFESLHQGISMIGAAYITLMQPRFEGVDSNWVVQDTTSSALIWIIGYNIPDVTNCTLTGDHNVLIGRQFQGQTLSISGYDGLGFNALAAYPKIRVLGNNFNLYDGNGNATIIGNNIMTMPNGNGFNSYALKMNNGANQIFYQTSMPVSGTYTKGDVVLTTTPTIAGTSGSQYVLHGWRRITTGSNHVLNTDWVEMRMPTGS